MATTTTNGTIGRMMQVLACAAALCLGAAAFAADGAAAHDPAVPPEDAAMLHPDQFGRPHLPYPHPEVPAEDIVWAGVTVIVIVGLFLAAASVGPFVHALRDEELPPSTHSHDEPPGASGHHGPGGTHDTGHAHGH